MVKDGFMGFVKALGDESFQSVGINGSQASMDSFVQLSTYTFDPFSFPKVKELNLISGVIAFLFIMLYLGAGAAWAVLCRISPGLASTISEITDIDRDIAGKQYIQNISVSIFALLLGHIIIRLILTLNLVLTSLVAKYTLVSAVDISSNYILYLFSGLVFLVNVMFYCWRLIVICGVASFSLIIGAMLVYGATRNMALFVVKYFIMVTFLQLIVMAVITAGMIAFDTINGFNLQMIPFAASLPGMVLFVVLLMSCFVSLAICLGPALQPVLKIVVKAAV
jgi:hypothetical protein